MKKSRRKLALAGRGHVMEVTGVLAAIVALAALGAPVNREPAAGGAAEDGKSATEKPAPGPAPAGAEPAPDAPARGGPSFEARLADGSALKLTVRTPRIELATPYGKLDIPFADIRRLEVGIRLKDGEEKRIDAAIADLGAEDFDRRESASAELAALGEKAYAAVERASKHEDAEIARRAAELLEKLRETVPAERLPRSHLDVVYTAESMIAGYLGAASLRVTTAQFGDLELRLTDVRELRFPALEEPEPGAAIPDPGNLAAYQNHVGKVLAIRLTGSVKGNGSVWGTDVYTMDSNLPMAAMHAGVLKPGQTKVVQVRILGQTNSFVGSNRNGISSQGYGGYPAAFEFLKPKGR